MKVRLCFAYHGEVLIWNIIVDSDPGPRPRQQTNRWSRGRPIDHHTLSTLTSRRYLGDGYPEYMVWLELVIVDDSLSKHGGQRANKEKRRKSIK